MNNKSTFDNAFNIVYKKYHKKDYFMVKMSVRNRLKYAKEHDIKVVYSEVKNYINRGKLKLYNFTVKRLDTFVDTGKKVCQSEKFTHTLFKMLKVY